MACVKEQRRATKEQLSLAVRKDFNAAMTSEPDTVTSFLYTVENQGISMPSLRLYAEYAYILQTRLFVCTSPHLVRNDSIYDFCSTQFIYIGLYYVVTFFFWDLG